jgi:23S rRNA (uracil1939-C5)-methyltransferase
MGSVKDIVPHLDIHPDTLLLDPPRAGLDSITLEAVLTFRASRIVYVSCDISTLTRDLKKFMEGGYNLIEITPVDMFPQTYHVEAVVLLEKQD